MLSVQVFAAQGEEMLDEQDAHDEHRRLVRPLKLVAGSSPMRTHVTRNIACRLREEQQRDATQVLTIQQKCQNIRKHIASMGNLRRDLVSEKTRLARTIYDSEGTEDNKWAGLKA